MRSLRIIVVDDNRDFAESIAEVLSAKGHDVIVSFSGRHAVSTCARESFDLALLDIKMPGLNGVESLSRIRRIRPDANVVMMTAYSVDELLQRAIDEGALGVLRKPFPLQDLDDMLGSLSAR